VKKEGGCTAIVNALRIHAKNARVAEFACRAIFNLSADPSTVGELGKIGCALVVEVLKNHLDKASTVAQALLAVHSLAVKIKLNKVHNANTKRLVNEGAIEVLVAALQKFAEEGGVQRAAAMATASLGRLPDNKEKLGGFGACELVMKSLKRHMEAEEVVGKLAVAIETLCQDSPSNTKKLTDGEATGLLLTAFQRHEKSVAVVADLFRGLIILSAAPNQQRATSQAAFALYIKAMKTHEKSAVVGRWGCNMIYSAAAVGDDRKKHMLGTVKACEAVIAVVLKHGAKSVEATEWACKALVALSTLPANKAYFLTTEACTAVVAALQALGKEPIIAGNALNNALLNW
jgi:hypothetical protein